MDDAVDVRQDFTSGNNRPTRNGLFSRTYHVAKHRTSGSSEVNLRQRKSRAGPVKALHVRASTASARWISRSGVAKDRPTSFGPARDSRTIRSNSGTSKGFFEAGMMRKAPDWTCDVLQRLNRLLEGPVV